MPSNAVCRTRCSSQTDSRPVFISALIWLLLQTRHFSLTPVYRRFPGWPENKANLNISDCHAHIFRIIRDEYWKLCACGGCPNPHSNYSAPTKLPFRDASLWAASNRASGLGKVDILQSNEGIFDRSGEKSGNHQFGPGKRSSSVRMPGGRVGAHNSAGRDGQTAPGAEREPHILHGVPGKEPGVAQRSPGGVRRAELFPVRLSGTG